MMMGHSSRSIDVLLACACPTAPEGRLNTPLRVLTVGCRGDSSHDPSISVALVDDYDVVLVGLAHMFDRYPDRIVVAELDANEPVTDEVDIVLYDTFAQPEADHGEIDVLVAHPSARRVVVYTWNYHPDLIGRRSARGRAAICPRPCRRASWWRRWRRSTGAKPWSAPRPGELALPAGLDWPGRSEGLTNRESEILALITQGKSERRGGGDDVSQHELGQDLHPLGLSQDRGDQPDPGGTLGHRARIPARSPSHRPLARRTLNRASSRSG